MSKLVLVEWVDSASVYGWHHLNENDSIAHCVSVGILKKEDEKQIVLVSGFSDSGSTNSSDAIPKCSIKRIRQLKVEGG